MAFKLVLVALCVAAASGLPATYHPRPVALAAVPRAVSSYSSGVTHAVAVEERTVARPLALTYNVAPSYGYAHSYAPVITAKAYRAPLYAPAVLPAATAGVYAAPHAAPVAIAAASVVHGGYALV